jgi:ATP-binding cassette, subfamily B, bacterial
VTAGLEVGSLDEPLETVGGRGAIEVLRRGLAASPELRVGVVATLAMAFGSAVGKLTLPILIQQIVNQGLTGSGGFRAGYVVGLGAVGLVVIVAVGVLTALTGRRLVRSSQDALYSLRSRAFAHIHRLSLAEHNETRRGVLVSRVTSDIETLARFAEWGAVSWVVQGGLAVGVFAVLAWYSWQLALIALVAFIPAVPVLKVMQRQQLDAYDDQRVRVGDTLSEFSETIGGSGVIRAYGLQRHRRQRLRQRVRAQYRAEMRAARAMALMYPLSDIVVAVATAAVVVAGVTWGPSWGLDVGEMIAVLFLVSLLQGPVAELSEVLDQTQTALAGWRKVLDLLDQPVDVIEPDPGLLLPPGALAVRTEALHFAYRDGAPVLRGIDVDIAAGANVAVVGETGSGKTTFARLLVRLADPTAGRVLLGGLDLTTIAADERHRAIRIVPQDGFLFDTTVRENVKFGRPGAEDRHADAAVEELGLRWWVDQLPYGLDTRVGERGEALSVGERQLVALARAELADPGLLILDEATAAVDPRTERALAEAMVRVARGRTTISIAHRMSTAEAADVVLVFADGRLVEHGHHAELVAADGAYARLHRSWVSQTTQWAAPALK